LLFEGRLCTRKRSVFDPFAFNLVPGDTNIASDVILFSTGSAQAFPILTFSHFLLIAK
jgi:hypothetical protein